MGIQEDGRQCQVLGIKRVDCWKSTEEERQGRLDGFSLATSNLNAVMCVFKE